MPGHSASDRFAFRNAPNCFTRSWFRLAPCGSSWNLQLLPSPPTLCHGHEFLQIERHVIFQHEIDCPGQLVGDDADGLALAVHLGQLIKQLLGRGIVADKEHGRLGKGPLQMGIADLGGTLWGQACIL